MTAVSVLLLLASLAIPAVDQSEASYRLWQCQDDLNEMGITYHQRIAEILLQDRSQDDGTNWIRVLVIPSFEPEWAITIRPSDMTCEYRVADRQLWDANWVPVEDPDGREAHRWSEDPVSVPVSLRTVPLAGQTVLVLERTWRELLWRTDGEQEFGADGTVYQFSSSSLGACGEVWSPSPETIAGRLVHLADLLRRLAIHDVGEGRNRLEQDVRKVTDELQQLILDSGSR